ncbi:hypothetical protein [Saccharothrix xinjiangensis]|uniref:Uncharacterized protein n=1 Tax=Saccharothrix xinjiangensis TaxID=204798 RepID=A0ABV9Y282_9PSEU
MLKSLLTALAIGATVITATPASATTTTTSDCPEDTHWSVELQLCVNDTHW